MAYVEFLRVRKSLAWHVAVLAVLTLLAFAFAGHTSVNINGNTGLHSGMTLPLGLIAPFAILFAAVFGSSAGTSLNRENQTRDLSWTKPVPRMQLALQFVLIDLAGVAVAFAAALAAAVVFLLHIGVDLVPDPELANHFALALGIGIMWYALVQVLTFSFGGGARAIAGVLWPVALFLAALNAVPGMLGTVARALNVLNPLAYMSGFNSGSSLDVWVLAVAFCAIAVTLWPRKEA